VPVSVSTIAGVVHRRADQGTRDSAHCAAYDRVSHVVAASRGSERGSADTTDHGSFLGIGAGRQTRGDGKRKNEFPH